MNPPAVSDTGGLREVFAVPARAGAALSVKHLADDLAGAESDLSGDGFVVEFSRFEQERGAFDSGVLDVGGDSRSDLEESREVAQAQPNTAREDFDAMIGSGVIGYKSERVADRRCIARYRCKR